ncbi:sensor histidine kinase [Streptacidiphilus jiangxiensis]|uniref:histidine kinase n=1 Tax=Streptacidiphilus jiangxiensis TaxID=235985 RepID=A0A1H7KTX7_STRJI|nr:sensor histidine kinase KdpD [Streptacidiphilus jiangxiensis]SEK90323.1 two-component system, OmpR family, sensor histidine kinase KdpD [Streptacidiphilus jiangxiensis]
MGRGRLRIYLGAAPGVGKTFAMLGEGKRRAERGTDVVAAFVETHGRVHTADQVEGLEVVPRRTMTHRGADFTEMDLDAVLARRPAVALVDELAHTNVPGSRHDKRWQDVEELLDAGIDVISTVNIQHLESLGDAVEGITGVRQQETVPDEVVRRADQIELVDMAPEALRRRLAHGNVYAPEKIDAALAHYFRPGNLTALRELALLWVADRVDEYLQRYRAENHIASTWQARERIVVGLTGGPEGRTLIRRAARIAAKGSGSEILAVYVSRSDGLTSASPKELTVQRGLVEDLGGTFHHVLGDNAAEALLDFARGVNATQIVLGSSRRKPWQWIFGPGVGATVAREAGDIDVHIVTHEQVARGRVRPIRRIANLGLPRTVAGWLVGVGGPLLLTWLLGYFPDTSSNHTEMLLYLGLTVGAALLGGLFPALASAAVGSLLINWFYTPPLHTLTISSVQNIIAVAVFLAVALSVAYVVDLAARRTAEAARSRAEAETLSFLASTVLGGNSGLPALLERVRETFQMESVVMLERPDEFTPWRTAGCLGPNPVSRPEDADVDVPVGDHLALALSGRVLPAGDRRVLVAFAAQAAVLLEKRRLEEEAAEARRLAEGNRIRTALLAAVSHDLRTPLAGIKASVTSLRSDDVAWEPEDEAELLAGIEAGADRLDHLIGNLLDMSRLQTGTVVPIVREIDLDEVVPLALLGVASDAVRTEIPETLPMISADPGLLERALGNVIENAVKYNAGNRAGADGGTCRVAVSASELNGRVEVRVADHGPGIPDEAKDRVFEPFQRYGDAPRGAGVGLGLAVARGFVEATGGTLTAEDTPGGGLTMVFTLPCAAAAVAVVPPLTHPALTPERQQLT